MLSNLRAIARLIGLAFWIVVLLPAQFAIVRFWPDKSTYIPIFFHRRIAELFGMTIEAHGKVSEQGPIVFMANHSSYLDIIALSALVPISFVAKAEIAKWPLFGTLAQLQNTVFIDRKRRNAAEHLDAVQKHLRKGGNIVIFPEGTSGDGSRVMPFKHTLFRVVDSGSESNPVVIQPVVIAYTHVNGLPVGRYERPYFCWYGDMDMIPHLWNVLKLGSFKVDITFLPPIQKNQFEDHKALSHYCQTLVSNTFSAKIRGRDAVHPMALAATSA